MYRIRTDDKKAKAIMTWAGNDCSGSVTCKEISGTVFNKEFYSREDLDETNWIVTTDLIDGKGPPIRDIETDLTGTKLVYRLQEITFHDPNDAVAARLKWI